MEERKQQTWVVGVIVLLIALGALVWYVFTREAGFKKATSGLSGGDKATTTLDVGGVTLVIPPGSSASVEEVKPAKLPPAPSLDRKVSFPASFPDEARELWLKQFADLKTQLTKSPNSSELWLGLGLTWKMVEDYEGARLAWEYVTKLSPSDPVAFGNLGFLYGYYLHDNIKAEQNFKIALHNGSQELYLYQQVFEFYRDVLKDKAKAQVLVEEGRRVTGDTEFFDKLLSAL